MRLLRVARGFQLLSKLLTFDGLKYVAALGVFLIFGGGAAFASVESSIGHHVSTWDGIWWAIGTATTEGSDIQVTTNAGRAIAIVLMLAGIGIFSILTGAIAQHFLAGKQINSTNELSYGESVIMERLDQLTAHLDGLPASAADD
jgi:voltage-gated potassium channel